ncbi:MAG: HlyD family efflux transporter periplasmic adaptor subunit [Gammaproteobacteria bacterium]
MSQKIRPKEIIRQRNRRLKAVTLVILLTGLTYFGYHWYCNRDWVSTDDAFVTGHLITLKAQTDGTIVEILAENTQHVQQGQVLVRLDGIRARIDLEQAQAELGEAVRAVMSLKARVETLKQRIATKKAALNQVGHDLERFVSAAREGAVSDQQVQNARDRIVELNASIAEVKAERTAVEAQVLGTRIATHPTVEKAKSRVRKAFLAYQRRAVRAPVSGYIAKRRAQIGDRVQAGAPLLVIVPLNDLWIEANFLETEIAGIRPGQSAEVRVSAYGDQVLYHGRVQGLYPGTGSSFALLPTDNSTGNFIHITERVPVRISLEADELKDHPLQPGLSTLTRIDISEPGGALLNSIADTVGEAYRTEVYTHELEGVEQLIEEIIKANRLDLSKEPRRG